MLRGVMGMENFWKGIRSYYSKFINGNTSTANKNVFTIPVQGAPVQIILDPDNWVLMDGLLVKRK